MSSFVAVVRNAQSPDAEILYAVQVGEEEAAKKLAERIVARGDYEVEIVPVYEVADAEDLLDEPVRLTDEARAEAQAILDAEARRLLREELGRESNE